jgi:hypothetical protein
MKLLKTLLTELVNEPLANKAMRKTPAMQTIVVSFLNTIKRMINPIKPKYSQCSAVNSTSIKIPPHFQKRVSALWYYRIFRLKMIVKMYVSKFSLGTEPISCGCSS